MLSGMFDVPSDPQFPGVKPRKTYDPSQYGSLKDSRLFKDIQTGAGQDVARMGANVGAKDAGATNEYAQRQMLGALQPWDEAQKQGQYSSYLGQMENQDALAQAIFEQQRRMAEAQQAAMGQLAGLGGGFALAKKRGLVNTNKGLVPAFSDPGMPAATKSVYADYGVK